MLTEESYPRVVEFSCTNCPHGQSMSRCKYLGVFSVVFVDEFFDLHVIEFNSKVARIFLAQLFCSLSGFCAHQPGVAGSVKSVEAWTVLSSGVETPPPSSTKDGEGFLVMNSNRLSMVLPICLLNSFVLRRNSEAADRVETVIHRSWMPAFLKASIGQPLWSLNSSWDGRLSQMVRPTAFPKALA